MYYTLPNVELLKKLMNKIPIKKSNDFQFSESICSNCGKPNHISKFCPESILSYGIICYNEYNKKIILIKRRYSISFFDFIHGRYIINNLNFIIMLFENMTKSEKTIIKEKSFNELWDLINDLEKEKNKSKDISKNKFYLLKDGIYINNQMINLEYLINETTSKELELEFPKGKRNKNIGITYDSNNRVYNYETNYECAIREFNEETGIYPKTIKQINSKQYSENFIGSNGKQYEYIYYILIINEKVIPTIIKSQEIEIGEIVEINYEDALIKLNKRKKNILLKLEFLLN